MNNYYYYYSCALEGKPQDEAIKLLIECVFPMFCVLWYIKRHQYIGGTKMHNILIDDNFLIKRLGIPGFCVSELHECASPHCTLLQ